MLWICTDQQRFDTLGCYGNRFVNTPNIDEPAIRVPFIVSWPARIPPGRRSESLVEAVDIAPTLLEVAGLPPAAGM